MGSAELNSRQAALALALVETDRPLSARDLGEKAGTSARTVRYNLPVISTWFSKHGARILSKPGVGISLAIHATGRPRLRDELRQEKTQSLLSAPERLSLIFFELLSTAEYRSRKQLANAFSTSEATLYRDLENLELHLITRPLRLDRHPHLGIRIVGAEEAIRQRLVTLLFNLGLEAPLLDICLWGPRGHDLNGSPSFPAQAHVLKSVCAWNLTDAWRYVGLAKQAMQAAFSEDTQLHLALYWAIMLMRLRNGCRLGPAGDRLASFGKLTTYTAVEAAARRLAQETGLQLSQEELLQLAVLFFAAPQDPLASNLVASQSGAEARTATKAFARKFAREVGSRIGHHLVRKDILVPFAEHLDRARTRTQCGLTFHNPLTEQVRTHFPDLWKATVKTAIENIAHFSEVVLADEIANLTLYMALAFGLTEFEQAPQRRRVVVTCPNGGVAVWMLVSRLQKELPEIEIVNVVPVSRMSRFDNASIDAVISTIQLRLSHVPVVTVSPLLPDQDVALLRQKLNLGSSSSSGLPPMISV
jgi:transcriptional antiterminator